jgi:hypothetical protein
MARQPLGDLGRQEKTSFSVLHPLLAQLVVYIVCLFLENNFSPDVSGFIWFWCCYCRNVMDSLSTAPQNGRSERDSKGFRLISGLLTL